MSVNTKMAAIADEIRFLSGTSDLMSLDAMKNKLSAANTEIITQRDIITNILTAINNDTIDSDLENTDPHGSLMHNTTELTAILITINSLPDGVSNDITAAINDNVLCVSRT